MEKLRPNHHSGLEVVTWLILFIAYHHVPSGRKIVAKDIGRLQGAGVIELATLQCISSPLIIVPKRDSSKRILQVWNKAGLVKKQCLFISFWK